MKVFASFCSLLCMAFATSANAQWQYTNWGMSPDEVAAASGGEGARALSDPERQWDGVKIAAEGAYQSGSYNFDTEFFFTNEELVSVKLNLISDDLSTDASKLRHSLYAVYGEPFAESSGMMKIVTWHDAKKNNRLDLIVIGDLSVSLQYRPLRDASSSGL